MSAKVGQRSLKPTEMSRRYTAQFLEDMDGRSLIARALRGQLRELTNDLGGIAQLSYQERSLAKRVVHLQRLIEQKERALMQGDPVDQTSYFSAVTLLSSLLSKLGLKRRAKQLPSLTEYLNGKASSPHAEPTPTIIDNHSLTSHQGDPS
ncbi:MAG: hypothetical protein HZB34_07740 [Nitrospirae bacterium]|nr:hypothetical protein [Nitrospirota bacterium]